MRKKDIRNFMWAMLAMGFGVGFATEAAAQGRYQVSMEQTAVEQKNGLWIERKSGQKVGYLFTKQPKLTYTATAMVVTAGGAQAEFPLSDVQRLYFASDVTASSVEQVQTDSHGSELIIVTGDGVQLSGFPADQPVNVVDTGGRSVSQLLTDHEGRATVSLQGCPTGIYLVRIGQHTLKLKR